MNQILLKRKRDYTKNVFGFLFLIGLAYCAPKEELTTYIAGQNTDSEIINGVPVTTDELIARSTVAIFKNNNMNCTGTILKSNVILTAAHCLDEKDAKYTVKFATNVETEISKDLQISAKKIITHENYVNDPFVEKEINDIGLIILETQIPYGYVPAKLLTSTEEKIFNGTEVEIAGYGFTSVEDILGKDFFIGGKILTKVKVPVLNSQYSQSEIQLDQSSGTGSCNGDSGGPAFITIKSKTYLWGITSRGAPGCKTDSICTNATRYIDWIKLQLKKFNRNL